MCLIEHLNRLLGQPRDQRSGATPDPGDIPHDFQHSLSEVQRALRYTFKSPGLLYRALVHRSHAHATGVERLETNERLEFLGDAILGLLASEYLYRSYPERDEGDLTKMKSRLVCGANLAAVAVQYDLGDHVQMSKGEEATGGRDRASILADVVEALFGAVYLDGGLEAVRGVLDRWLFEDADEQLDENDLGNNKSKLQEMVQARFKMPPRYRIIDTEGPDHDRIYDVEVSISGLVFGRGRGPSKKIAEQEAAGNALEELEQGPAVLTEENDD